MLVSYVMKVILFQMLFPFSNIVLVINLRVIKTHQISLLFLVVLEGCLVFDALLFGIV